MTIFLNNDSNFPDTYIEAKERVPAKNYGRVPALEEGVDIRGLWWSSIHEGTTAV